ncbi:hypothetical protein FB451DRAFT_1182943 [Mycena latifolia]|nr:hypothetical protein FB451DRAFT_1182943 [Mycena latifolia]
MWMQRGWERNRSVHRLICPSPILFSTAADAHAARHVLCSAAPKRFGAVVEHPGSSIHTAARSDTPQSSQGYYVDMGLHSHSFSGWPVVPAQAHNSDGYADTAPDLGPWPGAFHAAFFAQVSCTVSCGLRANPRPVQVLRAATSDFLQNS